MDPTACLWRPGGKAQRVSWSTNLEDWDSPCHPQGSHPQGGAPVTYRMPRAGATLPPDLHTSSGPASAGGLASAAVSCCSEAQSAPAIDWWVWSYWQCTPPQLGIDILSWKESRRRTRDEVVAAEAGRPSPISASCRRGSSWSLCGCSQVDWGGRFAKQAFFNNIYVGSQWWPKFPIGPVGIRGFSHSQWECEIVFYGPHDFEVELTGSCQRQAASMQHEL